MTHPPTWQSNRTSKNQDFTLYQTKQCSYFQRDYIVHTVQLVDWLVGYLTSPVVVSFLPVVSCIVVALGARDVRTQNSGRKRRIAMVPASCIYGMQQGE